MKSILNLTFPATFKFEFTKVELQDGKRYENTYGVRGAFEVNSHASLEELIMAIAKQCNVNPSLISYRIIA